MRCGKFLPDVYFHQAVFITSTGAWKLGGFGFAVSTEQASGDSNGLASFHYPVSQILS